MIEVVFFFFSSRRRHTRFDCDWSSDVCSSDLKQPLTDEQGVDVLVGQRLLRDPPRLPVLDHRDRLVRQQVELRSEERRVGEEGRSRWAPYHLKKKKRSKKWHEHEVKNALERVN